MELGRATFDSRLDTFGENPQMVLDPARRIVFETMSLKDARDHLDSGPLVLHAVFPRLLRTCRDASERCQSLQAYSTNPLKNNDELLGAGQEIRVSLRD